MSLYLPADLSLASWWEIRFALFSFLNLSFLESVPPGKIPTPSHISGGCMLSSWHPLNSVGSNSLSMEHSCFGVQMDKRAALRSVLVRNRYSMERPHFWRLNNHFKYSRGLRKPCILRKAIHYAGARITIYSKFSFHLLAPPIFAVGMITSQSPSYEVTLECNLRDLSNLPLKISTLVLVGVSVTTIKLPIQLD